MVESAAAWVAPGSAPPTAAATPEATRIAGPGPATSFDPRPNAPTAVAPPPGAIPAEHTGTRPVPLRPLSVLELIDAAIGAVRSVPRLLLLRACGLVALVGVVGVGLQWAFDSAIADAVAAQGTTVDDFGDPVYPGYSGAGGFATFAVDMFIPIVLSGFATTILAGLFATSIKRYVDGEVLDPRRPPEDQRKHRWVLLRLGLITLLPRAVFVALLALVASLAATNPSGGYGGLNALFVILGVPLCSWATAQFAVAAPVAVLEGHNASHALARSGQLASQGRWRTWWSSGMTLFIGMCATLLLVLLSGTIAGRHLLGAVDLDAGATAYRNLLGYTLAIVLPLLLTVPFRATTATMIYVDRRFRREGLDIRIGWARVARNDTDRKAR